MECRAIGGSVAITHYRGTIVPCCITDTSDKIWEESNIFKLKTLDDIYNSYQWFQMEDVMDEGKFPLECSQCEMMEHNGHQSIRGRFNRQLTRQKVLQRLHIALDYECNLSCRSCRPGISSRWDRLDFSNLTRYDDKHYRVLEPEGDYTENMIRLLENTDLSNLTRVRLSGGEPFLSKHIDRFMDMIPTEQIHFSVNTNGTVVYPLPKFKSVNIELSIDATGDLFESMRYPAKWPMVQRNMKQWEKQGPVSINCTLSVMNVNHIQKVMDLGYPTKVYPIYWPAYLRHTQIPIEHRKKWLTTDEQINTNIMFPYEEQTGALEAMEEMDQLMHHKFPNEEICQILEEMK